MTITEQTVQQKIVLIFIKYTSSHLWLDSVAPF